MTKQEAIEAMMRGQKVTHRYFSDNEFIRMQGDTIITEEGYRFWANEFWDYRTGESWETGWEIFLEVKQ